MSDDERLARMILEADAVARERHEAAKARRAVTPDEPTKVTAAPVTRGDFDRFATWWRVDVPLWDASFLWPAVLLVAASLGVACVVLGSGALRVLAGVALAVATASLWGAWRWLRFRTWRSRVGFAVEGWSDLVDFAGFGRDEAWRHGEVTVSRAATADDAALEALLQAAFELYARDAERAYYTCEGADHRLAWIARQGSARGSFNRHVVRHLKALVEDRLAPIQRKTRGIRAVTVALQEEVFEVRRPRGEDG